MTKPVMSEDKLKINPAKSISEAVSSAFVRNSIIIGSQIEFQKFRNDFEAEFFSSVLNANSFPLLILVERPNNIPEYYSNLIKRPGLFDSHKVEMLDGVVNFVEAKNDWKVALLTKKIIITSCATALNILTHAFVKLTDFKLLYIPLIPSANTNHPFCKLMKLFYDCEASGRLTRIVGLASTDHWDTDVMKIKGDNHLVYALNDWNLKVRNYVNDFHCAVVNVVPTLPIPKNVERSSTQNISWSLFHQTSQVKKLFREIEPKINDRILVLVEDEEIKESLLGYIFKSNVFPSKIPKRKKLNASSLTGNFETPKSFIVVGLISQSDSLLKENFVDHIFIHLNSKSPIDKLLSNLNQLNIPSTNFKVSAAVEDNGAKTLGHFKSLFNQSIGSEKNLVINDQTGAVLHPLIATELLMKFCSYLPKVSSNGKLLSGLQVLTVLAKRTDENGTIIPHDPKELFVTKIIMPERLYSWFNNDPIIGDIASNRTEAQSNASFKAFKRVIELGLVDDHLLITEELRSESFSDSTSLIPEDELLSKDTGPSGSLNGDFGPDSITSEETAKMQEIIPKNLIYEKPFDQDLFLYKIEYELGNGNLPIPELNLPAWSRILLSGGGNFLNTKNGLRCFGVLLPSKLPLGLLPIQIPLGNDFHLEASIIPIVSFTQPDRELLEQIISIQYSLFSFLCSRPVSQNEDSKNLFESFESLKMTTCYFIVPLIREGFVEEFPNYLKRYENYCKGNIVNDSGKGEFLLDAMLINDLFTHKSRPIKQLFDDFNPHGDKVEQFVLTQQVLIAPYSGMFYRFRRIYNELNPSSPFGVKNMPQVKNYADFVKQKYFSGSDNFNVDMNQPLIGVGRIENFSEISQWILEDDPEFEHQVKKRRKDNDSLDSKSALIPSLIHSITLPYWMIRTMMPIPRIMFEIERQLLALEFYHDLGIFNQNLELPIALCIKSLTAGSAALPYNYERLELLGDSLLKMMVSIDLMSSEERVSEGRLTQYRQAKISNNSLYRIGVARGIHRYAAFTLFSPKLWTFPGIECLIRFVFTTNPLNVKYLEGLNETARIFHEKLLKVMVDPEFRWKLLKALDERTINREDPWTLTHDGKLLPPPDKKGIKEESVGITMYGMSIPSKFISDMVEASVGAIFQGLGMDLVLDYLIQLGILTPGILNRSQIPKLKVLGNLMGNPADVLPIVRRNSTDHTDTSRKRSKIDSSSKTSITKDEKDGIEKRKVNIPSFSNAQCRPDDQSGFDFDQIEAILGYKFEERTLLFTAFTLPSKNPYFCNERLEWLGDAVLDWIVTKYFYYHGAREMNPHELTEARKSSVSNVSFGEIAVYYRLPQFLRFKNELLGREIEKFTSSLNQIHRQYQDISCPEVFWELCQHDPVPHKALGDLWEAIAGAIFVDLNFDLDRFQPVMLKLMEPFLKRHLDPDLLRANPISLCLESWNKLGALRSDIIFEEEITNDSVGAHTVIVRLKVRSTIVGEGRAGSRILAKQLAAAKAVEFLSTSPLLVQEILKDGNKK
jgi:dsRNA-specific ribonuclease